MTDNARRRRIRSQLLDLAATEGIGLDADAIVDVADIFADARLEQLDRDALAGMSHHDIVKAKAIGQLDDLLTGDADD